MAITKNSARQYPLMAFVDVTYDMLTSGSAVAAMDIPAGATVVGGYFVVDTVWNSGTSDVLDIGDGDNDDRYTSSQIDLTSLGATALDVTMHEYTVLDTIDLTWTGAGSAPDQGAARLVVEYILDARAHEAMPVQS